ncbi:hypothetical protein [Actinoplanes sp. HUAS TT8]|uniref:hypothetical protein n=1 Tax=Actinoplanes sp. HUAS TT8 TaxID=3447453 RepID=UPI003F52507D
MSSPGHSPWPDAATGQPPRPGPSPAHPPRPNAERYLLEADSLRRRQLRAALLHGSRQSWRERRRIWPAVLAGVGAVAIVIAAIAVYGAFQKQKRINEQQQQLNNPRPAVTVSVSGG